MSMSEKYFSQRCAKYLPPLTDYFQQQQHSFSHLNEYRFRHNFINTINPMCICGAATEITFHYLLCCGLYSVQRAELLDSVYN